MALFTVQNLSLAYEGRHVIDKLSFTVEQGDYLCIVGENGSGKSTLLRGLLGMISPTAGRILRGDGLGRRDMGYLPQQTKQQRDFPASVEEVVRTGCLNRAALLPAPDTRSKVEQNLRRLGIDDLRRRPYAHLSGGQQQRVLLARALCAAEKLLLLDEPTAGLDPMASTELYRLIDSLHREGLTVIMVTHDIPHAMEYATHILHLGTGSHWFGTAQTYGKSDRGFTGGDRHA
ncbi:MAG: ABC transporter ATP-binding protein [Ruminococcaceae bacterium]|nr:ABC transporter ATP-binding protein [Oscillospiraceae bacterium]